MQASFFTSDSIFLFAVPPVTLFVGASDIGQGFYWPETGDQAGESNPGPTQQPCCKVKGSNPGPTRTSCAKVVQKIHKSRLQLPCGMCRWDDGQRPDQQMMARLFIFLILEVHTNSV
jgi:hypothetical protein